MANYVQSTNFATKDNLSSGDPLKIVKGTEINTEFNNIATAVATKADLISPTFTGTPSLPTGTTAITQAFGSSSTLLATTAFVQAALQVLHPIGSIYINATNATNPGTLLGFGTWVAFGAGRVPVGFDAADPSFDTAEETGGSKDATVVSHTHTFSATTASAGVHEHIQGVYFENLSGTLRNGTGESGGSQKNAGVSGGSGVTGVTDTAGSHAHSVSGTTASAGSSATNANLQPYITVYMFKRTA